LAAFRESQIQNNRSACSTPLPVPPPQGGRERCGIALPNQKPAHAYTDMSAHQRLALPSRPALSLRIWILLFPQRQPDRRAGKLEGLAQGIDQITPVVVRHRIGAAAEQNKARRPALGLRQVVEPDAPAGDRGWWMRGGDLGQKPVERTRRRTLIPDRM